MRSIHSLLLVSAAAALGVLIAGCRAAAPRAAAMAPMAEIYVNPQCQVRAEGAARFSSDPVVCHLESRFNSTHIEERIDKGVATQLRVHVVEQEYLLQDVTSAPVIFVVQQLVPSGWRVDSEPRPDEMHDGTAVFRLVAQPRQIVRLHVGERREEPMGS